MKQQTPESVVIAFAKFISICLAAILLAIAISSCNTLNKAYKKVAADIPASVENKTKLVPYFMFHFPINEKTIIKDSIVHDFIESVKYDTVIVQKENEVYKYLYKVDTVIVNKVTTKTTTVKDTLGNFARQLEFERIIKENNAKDAQISIINAKLTNAIESENKANKRAAKLGWLLLLVFFCGLGSHWLRSKLF